MPNQAKKPKIDPTARNNGLARPWVKILPVRVREYDESNLIQVNFDGQIVDFSSATQARRALKVALLLCGGS